MNGAPGAFHLAWHCRLPNVREIQLFCLSKKKPRNLIQATRLSAKNQNHGSPGL